MSCADEAARLIPWYAAGSLDAARRSLVEAHLRDCENCRLSLGLAAEMVAHGERETPDSLARHVHAELLTDFVRDAQGLDREVVERIEGHLGRCELCAEAAVIVRGIPETFETDHSSAADRPTVSALQRVWEFLASTVLQPVPALAYLILVLVGFPLYRTLLPQPDPAPPPGIVSDAAGSLQIHFLRGARRGKPAEQRVDWPAQAPLLYLGIEPDLAADVPSDREYRVRILSGEAPVWSYGLNAAEIRRSLESDQLALVLAVPSSAVPPGTYMLRLLAAGEPEPLLEISFETVR